MTMSKFITFAGTIAAFSSLSFAWSISGGVFTNMGQPIPGVKITSSNYPGVNATTTDGGSFSITGSNTEALRQTFIPKESILFNHNVISISNVKANTITVSVMDALGKVAFSQTQHNVNGTLLFDLNRTSAKGAKYIRINADGHRDTYKLSKTVSLLKEGDPLPILIFVKDGFENFTYTMKAETETDVFIQMQPGTSAPLSSATVEPPKSSADATSSTTEPTSSSATVPASSETVSSSSAAPAIDCSAKTLKSDTEIMVDGRKVIVKFPNGNFTGDKPVPMLINYHQIFGSAADWVNDSKIGKVALADGAISIYPDGLETPGGQLGQAWNVGPCCTDANDTLFTRNIIKELTAQACVDPKRVYVAGWSMGGGMANYAGCVLADVVAAGASSAFDLTKEVLDAGQCNPARPYPILNFRSTNDGVVNYNGGFSQIVSGKPLTFLGAKETFKKWAELDGCTGEPKQNTPSAGCETYDSCQGGAKVVLCSQDIDHNEGDAQMGWDFVKQFSLP